MSQGCEPVRHSLVHSSESHSKDNTRSASHCVKVRPVQSQPTYVWRNRSVLEAIRGQQRRESSLADPHSGSCSVDRQARSCCSSFGPSLSELKMTGRSVKYHKYVATYRISPSCPPTVAIVLAHAFSSQDVVSAGVGCALRVGHGRSGPFFATVSNRSAAGTLCWA